MRFLFALLLFVPARMGGQWVVPPEKLSVILEQLQPDKDRPRLECSVEPLKPVLDFGFRFQSGFAFRVPMKQYFGPNHRWGIIAKITPDGGEPVYLADLITLPDVPRTKVVLELGGGFATGEGRYNVDWTLLDDEGRVCRKHWHFAARLNHDEHKVKVRVPPGAVTDISFKRSSATMAKDDMRPLRLTVLLHASPLSSHLRLRGTDRILLLSSLASLLDGLPTRQVRVVLFNLDQQREVFRSDKFEPKDFPKVAQAINALELGLVNYHVLQNASGHIDMIASLFNQELTAKDPADAVILMGPPARYMSRFPNSLIEERSDERPRFFYFQYKQNRDRGYDFPDFIQSALKKLGGKTISIHTPGEFADAIKQVEKRADRN